MDDPWIYFNILLRWLHILSAVAAAGGTIFMRVALLPAVAVLPDEQRKELHEAVRRRWAMVVMAAILILLVSGLANFFTINRGLPAELKMVYHVLFGVKFLLSLVVFFIASALVGRSPALAAIRKNARVWLTVNLMLVVAVICIAGVMRVARDTLPPERPGATTAP
ncbi:MAG: hypothetical protein HYS13_21920 [Planctomycetia bacterium]|nr:hypothetical protein [Planctomycetia bacterium]